MRDSYCTAIIGGLVLIVIIVALVYQSKSTPSSSPSTSPSSAPSTSSPTPTLSNESYSDTQTPDSFFQSQVTQNYPYNYWYLTAYPQYLQNWRWGNNVKDFPECADPDAYYPYQWPHQGRGWGLTGYGRRQ